MNKQAKIGFWFFAVVVASLIIAFYIRDYKTAAILFFGYVIIRIILNFAKKENKYEYY